jgi:hypothetical protein
MANTLLSAGDMTVLLQLQSLTETIPSPGVVVPSWTNLTPKAWAKPGPTSPIAQLPGEQSAPRRKREYAIRKRALSLPLRAIANGRTMLVLDACDDETLRDQTILTCVDAIDMTVGADGALGAAEAVTVYRGTDVDEDDASPDRSWTPAATDIAVRLEDADASELARIFGQEASASVRGIVPIETDLRLDDGITVTSGRHAGANYLVTARKIDPTLPGQAYYALGLSLTREAFV